MPSDDRLQRYADLALRVGLNLQEGQPLVLSGSAESRPLLRALARSAYRLGARAVVVDLHDPALGRIDLEDVWEAYLDEVPDWFVQARVRAVDAGAAQLSLTDADPFLLRGVDPARLARRMQAAARARRPYLERVGAHKVNWLALGAATPAWARAVFPELAPDETTERLWEAIFATVRLDAPDPEAAWRDHVAALEARAATLNRARFAALIFEGPGTELRVGLAQRHVWKSAVAEAQNGVRFVPNLPTEEVFTAPDPERVEGVVTSTRPLNIGGTLVEGLRVTFAGGRAVELEAAQGLEAVRAVLATDAAAPRLGEVALVETPNPVFDRGRLFLNTLYDENAASHLAFGRAYPDTLGLAEGDDTALTAAGGNASTVHLDWMIGSPEVDVWGERADGARVPLMKRGRWVDAAR
ncbi:aminopeptidase [Oceanithermus desulfurans]|uniref:Aminopeptidase T n=2 Tax=Oceanithermus desulfurans TaxID=227924 RepID=A0A511RJA4_9DEIN|nr:aminopeptidase [Oceanithermus desulfurans]MBB6029769.1 aminopeptidase [Oceanithermus desulfurans]GEM89730.1 aminopeptidase T [Oceanithermus desulfurans NBRC 100063]